MVLATEIVQQIDDHFVQRRQPLVNLMLGYLMRIRANIRSTKSHETARKGLMFRDASCDFVDRALGIETREPYPFT